VKRETSIPLADLLKLPAETLPAVAEASCCIREEVGAQARRYTAVIEAPLGRRALMDVLYALAPYKAHGPDRFGRVLDNWGIFDRAKSGGGASSNLFDQHVRSLGNNWRVFEAHRDAFVATFDDVTEGSRVVPFVAWQTSPDGKRRWLLDDADAGLPAEGHPDALVGLVMLVYLQPRLASKWPAWKPLVKDGKSNYIGPASVPMMALLHRRAILNSGFIHAVEALDIG
jgi:hypothetical protein